MAESTQIEAQDPDGFAPAHPRLRADAAQNRTRIVAAARQLFADRGLDAPMTAIARRAGVGAATLFRRFPDRRSLIDEVFSTQITHCESVLDDAAADPDPWHGFCTFVEELGRMQVEDRGFTEAFITTITEDSGVNEKSNHAEATFAKLVCQAQEAGRLRRDFDPSDLLLIFFANSGVSAAPPEHAHDLSRRLIAYLLQSFDTKGHGKRQQLPRPSRMALRDVFESAGATDRRPLNPPTGL
ncbi:MULTISPECIES: TetR/AcrR family transcriptional regulator [unclassified Brevibacterium]|uniref:TetR/AcrR family transcriptional regulator n=1 Tax=unclassified Brevibacterium TaxID=2614124 RepID=UPI00109221FB|nr:TetR/AcrR family transcriptional regulator [Brevibacterium sp. S22]TGD31478.1 TetR/AcrR family transcriptional regulator [Brevibacterium sp. S22]